LLQKVHTCSGEYSQLAIQSKFCEVAHVKSFALCDTLTTPTVNRIGGQPGEFQLLAKSFAEVH